MVNLRCE